MPVVRSAGQRAAVHWLHSRRVGKARTWRVRRKRRAAPPFFGRIRANNKAVLAQNHHKGRAVPILQKPIARRVGHVAIDIGHLGAFADLLRGRAPLRAKARLSRLPNSHAVRDRRADLWVVSNGCVPRHATATRQAPNQHNRCPHSANPSPIPSDLTARNENSVSAGGGLWYPPPVSRIDGA